MFLAAFLKNLIRIGRLTLIDAAGKRHEFGGFEAGPAVTVRLCSRSLHWKLFLNPQLYAGKAYMDGQLTVQEGNIYDLLDLVGLNTGRDSVNGLDRWIAKVRSSWHRFQQSNRLVRSRKNVAHHYDLSDALYELFLDKNRQYSCAYFEEPGQSLDAAQTAKMRHIAAKLLLKPDLKILDIGSGWGGLANYLAESWNADVTGITLSENQLRYSRVQAENRGLDARTRFYLRDYREEVSKYDRIVSVGMFEHVGLPNYDRFFSKIRELLNEDGVALIHTISHMDEPFPTNQWLQKYIFPGGYAPALSEVLPAIERAGLWVTDIEILPLHYAETLRHWRYRFMSRRQTAIDLYDERFCRMWEFYLASSEMSFRRQGAVVAQLQLARSISSVPLTRGYILESEERQRLIDSDRPNPTEIARRRL